MNPVSNTHAIKTNSNEVIGIEETHVHHHSSGKVTERGEGSTRRVSARKIRIRNERLQRCSDSNKNKGPLETPNQAINSGPSSTELTLKEFKKVIQKKRKTIGLTIAGPSEPVSKSPLPRNEDVAVNFNAAGYYEIKVQQGHMSNLAAACE